MAIVVSGVTGLAVAAGVGLVTTPAVAPSVADAATLMPAGDSAVPVWPSLGSALPAGLMRPATTTTDEFKIKMLRRLERRVAAPALGRSVSVQVRDLLSGGIDYSRKGKTPRTPASTEKTATALAVLSAAGAKRRMPTVVRRNADGLGLTLVGGGDPLLSSTDLDTLARDTADALKSSGAPVAKQTVNFDDSVFAPATMPPGWSSNYFWVYAARPDGLSRDLRMVDDGGLDATSYFKARLRHYGIRSVRRISRVTTPGGSSQIARYDGHTIGDALWPMLQYSDNSIAENMIRHVAMARGFPTTPAGSAQAVRAELSRLGIPLHGVNIVDGSGLSRADTLTVRAMTSIVRASMNPSRPDLATGFRTAAFPTAGVSGTLASRFNVRGARCAIRRVMAKTGTLSNVVALSGIAASTDGRARAFSIVVNNKPGRASLDATRGAVDRVAAAVTGCPG